MTTQESTCPFCAFHGMDPQPIHAGFFGEFAHIGDTACCDDCATTAAFSDTEVEMLDWLRDQQVKESEAHKARQEANLIKLAEWNALAKEATR